MVSLVDNILPLNFLQLKVKCFHIPHKPFGFLDLKNQFHFMSLQISKSIGNYNISWINFQQC